ncbi:hypothetical protein [Azospirillum agricola]|uniref:hypothetical protein n=1 Tax=Azospirillum agricola TaxID=1720247 RepID=UPI000A0F0C10|nr:hypothetical protein [Azospirillum agricola]SMH37287.1 hypothetical protein SAMN02982994_1181 [Azospirillum lipoferum]
MLTFEDCLALSDAEVVMTEAASADTIGAFRVMARSSSHATRQQSGAGPEDGELEINR